MDKKLVAWARAVKARTRTPRPVLWLFTDAARGSDPLIAAAGLPKGLCGVVFRHDGVPDRAGLGRALARICRARRLGMVVAGDAVLAAALGAGVHLRGGRWPGAARPARRRGAWLSSSAHSVPDLRRARRAGADMVFLSPAFATASHPGAAGLGAARWGRIALQARGLAIFALGGISGAAIGRLPRRHLAGAGAIGALGPHSILGARGS